MARIDFPEQSLRQTHATIRMAFDETSTLIHEKGTMGNINISSILTRIIQDTGRFVEDWASDALYGIDHIRELCENTYSLYDNSAGSENHWSREIDEIYTFGLRRQGVDHGNYVMSRLNENVTPFNPYLMVDSKYRRILAVRVHVYVSEDRSDPIVECELKNITNSLHRNNPADLGEDGKLMMAPFEGGNPVPVDIYKQKQEVTA